MTTVTCLAPTCAAPAAQWTRGYCHVHYRRRLHRGEFGFRDTTQVKERIAELRSLGWTWEQIGSAAGMSHSIPYGLIIGRFQRALPETVEALMRVEPVPASSRRGASSLGLRRRVHALAWMGWPAAEVARRAGTTVSTLRTLMCPRRTPSYALVRRVEAVYEELSHVPGPSAHAARKARERGLHPPSAWDDIDDPNEQANVGECSRSAIDLSEVEHLERGGCHITEIARRMGVSPESIRTARSKGRKAAAEQREVA